MTLGRWLPDPPDLGPFRFGPVGASFAGGAAHLPGEPGRIAFFRPGARLPDGWIPGPPPKMDAEAWSRWARAGHVRAQEDPER